ncbi:NlpC/P60 family protein [Wenyingzhuangia sp. 2_MG-2023]|uniref:C40 family peptidase n=1 Tax=Wenyingzhuangia sp. 2_MG-2023 TaxID=3062639 RepID=UPI0026E38A8B|nr:NlpC/P60 family protein [Wenyingzhuangia sp. 2_MG-2023]MDO6737726.1 NlpC/P60 family protein [Wenyingzhuangia sp. 2_MG-2023]MDO6802565.1 NlpC/P60 family protein [Wenyingzhuangia sp. 1_MG-2023]
MKKTKCFYIFGIFILLFTSCKSTSYIQSEKNRKIVATAKEYKGTRYKLGGITKRGMDCSGLVYTSFLENNIKLPRISREQAKIGKTIALNQTVPGDLVFFKTLNSKNINHVGIVIKNDSQNIQFIHAAFEGVIVSSTQERYWHKNYIQAQRIINPKANNNQTVTTQYYTVKSGDTLYKISKTYHTSVKAIKEANKLSSDKINIGMVLKII